MSKSVPNLDFEFSEVDFDEWGLFHTAILDMHEPMVLHVRGRIRTDFTDSKWILVNAWGTPRRCGVRLHAFRFRRASIFSVLWVSSVWIELVVYEFLGGLLTNWRRLNYRSWSWSPLASLDRASIPSRDRSLAFFSVGLFKVLAGALMEPLLAGWP